MSLHCVVLMLGVGEDGGTKRFGRARYEIPILIMECTAEGLENQESSSFEGSRVRFEYSSLWEEVFSGLSGRGAG
jgi:hypothetical protein